MYHQVSVQCNSCNTILNFSACNEELRNVTCHQCKNNISVLFTYNSVVGKRLEKVFVTNCKFIPESQREKYDS